MKTVKKILNHIFIEGMSGMASGLFATLIIGTILTQIGSLIGSNTVGNAVFIIGKAAMALTGAGIGVGTAHRLGQKPYVVLSAVRF